MRMTIDCLGLKKMDLIDNIRIEELLEKVNEDSFERWNYRIRSVGYIIIQSAEDKIEVADYLMKKFFYSIDMACDAQDKESMKVMEKEILLELKNRMSDE